MINWNLTVREALTILGEAKDIYSPIIFVVGEVGFGKTHFLEYSQISPKIDSDILMCLAEVVAKGYDQDILLSAYGNERIIEQKNGRYAQFIWQSIWDIKTINLYRYFLDRVILATYMGQHSKNRYREEYFIIINPDYRKYVINLEKRERERKLMNNRSLFKPLRRPEFFRKLEEYKSLYKNANTIWVDNDYSKKFENIARQISFSSFNFKIK